MSPRKHGILLQGQLIIQSKGFQAKERQRALLFGFIVLAFFVPGTLKGQSHRDVIRFLHSEWRHNGIVALEALTQSFEKEFPHCKIALDYVPYESWTDAVIGSALEGKAPDLIKATSCQMEILTTHRMVADLSGYLDQARIGSYPIVDHAWKAFTQDHKIWGLPYATQPEAVTFYRRDLFRQFAINPPSYNERWTVHTALQNAGKLTQDLNHDGIIDRWGWVQRVKTGLLLNRSIRYYNCPTEPHIIPETQEGLRSLSFDGLARQRTTAFYTELKDVNGLLPEEIVGYGFHEAMTGFVSGNFAMVSTGSWLKLCGFDEEYPDFSDQYGKAWDIMQFPFAPGQVSVIYQGLFVARRTDHPDQAMKLIRYALQHPRFLTDMAWQSASVPTLKCFPDARWRQPYYRKLLSWMMYSFKRSLACRY